MISAVVLTKNEEKNIEKCLSSLSFCDEILVIDDFSDDQTVEIAKKMGAKVYRRRLNENFSAQRNFGLGKARGVWVLFVDADERIPSALAEEIKNKILNIKYKKYKLKIKNKRNKIVGYLFKRKDRFLGKWLKHGETVSVKFLRLARENAGRWSSRVHEVWNVKGKKEILESPLIHERKVSISEFIERINHYSTLRALQLWEKGERTNIFLILLYPLAKFCQNYFFRFGFLDGEQGFILAFLMSFHSLLARAKLFVHQHLGHSEFNSESKIRIFNY